MKKNWRVKYIENSSEYGCEYRVQRRIFGLWISGNFGYATEKQAEEAILRGEWFFEKGKV